MKKLMAFATVALVGSVASAEVLYYQGGYIPVTSGTIEIPYDASSYGYDFAYVFDSELDLALSDVNDVEFGGGYAGVGTMSLVSADRSPTGHSGIGMRLYAKNTGGNYNCGKSGVVTITWANAEPMTVNYRITPCSIYTPRLEQLEPIVYDGTAHQPVLDASATTVCGVEYVYYYCKTADGEYSKEIPSYTEVGTYELWCYAEAEGHGVTDKAKIVITVDSGSLFTVDVLEDGTCAISGIDGDLAPEIEIPSMIGGRAVTAINDYAFFRQSTITSVKLPAGITTIGEGAFYGCYGLASVTLPDAVTSIKSDAFAGCSSLDKIIVDGNADAVKSLYDWPDSVSVSGSGSKQPEEPPVNPPVEPDPPDDPSGDPEVPVGPEPVGPAIVQPADIVAAPVIKKSTTLSGCVTDASGAVIGLAEVKVGKPGRKGSAVSGSITMLGGRKCTFRSVYADLSSGPADVTVTPKGQGTMNLRVGALGDGTPVFGGDLNGQPVGSASMGTAESFRGSFHIEGFPSVIDDVVLNGGLSADGEPVEVTPKKWTCARAATVAYKKDRKTGEYNWVINNGKNDPKKTNLSGLKLTYTAKTGAFKGSFKAYGINSKGKLKKFTVNVTGIMVDGLGYGKATLKKVGEWSVTIAP